MNGVKAISAVLGLSLLVAGGASAQGWGGHGHGEARGSAPRQSAPRGGYAAPPPERFRPPAPRAETRGRGAPPIAEYYGPPIAYAPRGYAPPPSYYPARPGRMIAPSYGGGGSAWRRGEFLPRNYWGGSTLDPRRFRLRSPPPGYGWFAIGPNAYLVQRSTGLILDTAPGVQ